MVASIDATRQIERGIDAAVVCVEAVPPEDRVRQGDGGTVNAQPHAGIGGDGALADGEGSAAFEVDAVAPGLVRRAPGAVADDQAVAGRRRRIGVEAGTQAPVAANRDGVEAQLAVDERQHASDVGDAAAVGVGRPAVRSDVVADEAASANRGCGGEQAGTAAVGSFVRRADLVVLERAVFDNHAAGDEKREPAAIGVCIGSVRRCADGVLERHALDDGVRAVLKSQRTIAAARVHQHLRRAVADQAQARDAVGHQRERLACRGVVEPGGDVDGAAVLGHRQCLRQRAERRADGLSVVGVASDTRNVDGGVVRDETRREVESHIHCSAVRCAIRGGCQSRHGGCSGGRAAGVPAERTGVQVVSAIEQRIDGDVAVDADLQPVLRIAIGQRRGAAEVPAVGVEDRIGWPSPRR